MEALQAELKRLLSVDRVRTQTEKCFPAIASTKRNYRIKALEKAILDYKP